MKQLENKSPRVARWVQFLQDYDVEVKYFKGQKNTIADFLSRNTSLVLSDSEVCTMVNSVFAGITSTFDKIRVAQATPSLWELEDMSGRREWLRREGFYDEEGLVMRKGRVVVPLLAKDLMNEII